MVWFGDFIMHIIVLVTDFHHFLIMSLIFHFFVQKASMMIGQRFS